MTSRNNLSILEAKCYIEANVLRKYHELSRAMYKDTPEGSEEMLAFDFSILTANDDSGIKTNHEDFDLEQRAKQVFFHEMETLSEEQELEANWHVGRMLCIVHCYLVNDLELLRSFNVDIKFEHLDGINKEASSKELYELARKDLRELASLLYMRDIEPNTCKITFDRRIGDKKMDKDKQVVIENRYSNDQKMELEKRAILDALIAAKFQWLKEDPNPVIRDLIFNLGFIDGKRLEPTHEGITNLYNKIQPNPKMTNRNASGANLFRGMLAHELNKYINDALNRQNAVSSDTSIRLLIYSIFVSFGLIDFDLMETYTTNKEKADYIKQLPSDRDTFPRIRLS